MENKEIEENNDLNEKMMDIARKINGINLCYRSAIIIETEKGYIFEKDSFTGIYFVVGGGIKINESSEEAAKREIFEELGLNIENIKIKAIVERFFSNNNNKYHEIGFYYKYKLNKEIKLPKGFYILPINEIREKNIKPKIIYEIINSKNDNIVHVIMNE
jgi:8-oxo-dGTP pyrophosphatase MutT (NUDIX family)